jgi:hypothetical protein
MFLLIEISFLKLSNGLTLSSLKKYFSLTEINARIKKAEEAKLAAMLMAYEESGIVGAPEEVDVEVVNKINVGPLKEAGKGLSYFGVSAPIRTVAIEYVLHIATVREQVRFDISYFNPFLPIISFLPSFPSFPSFLHFLHFLHFLPSFTSFLHVLPSFVSFLHTLPSFPSFTSFLHTLHFVLHTLHFRPSHPSHPSLPPFALFLPFLPFLFLGGGGCVFSGCA